MTKTMSELENLSWVLYFKDYNRKYGNMVVRGAVNLMAFGEISISAGEFIYDGYLRSHSLNENYVCVFSKYISAWQQGFQMIVYSAVAPIGRKVIIGQWRNFDGKLNLE